MSTGFWIFKAPEYWSSGVLDEHRAAAHGSPMKADRNMIIGLVQEFESLEFIGHLEFAIWDL